MPSMCLDCYGIVTTGSLLIESGGRRIRRGPKAPQMRDLAVSEEEAKKKGQLGEELPFSAPRGRDGPHIAWPGLRQVIAERSEQHVVDGVRAKARPGSGVTGVVVPRPGILRQIRVLHTPLHAALRTVVELVPEAEGAFDNVVDVASATARGSREAAAGRRIRRARGLRARPCWERFITAAAVVEQRTAVADADGIARPVRKGVGRARGVFATSVSVDVELGVGVNFKGTQPRGAANWSEGAVRPRRYISQLSRAVAPDAVSSLEVSSEVNFFGHDGKASREAHTTADPGIIEGTRNGSRASASGGRKGRKGKITAGINTIAEIAEDSHYFVVAPSRIEGRLHQQVGSSIEGVSGAIKGVVQTTACTGSVDEEVRREIAPADGGLRSLDPEAESKLPEVLHDAEAVGALPGPADDVLRVNLEGEGFLTVGDALLAFGHQAPHLTGRDRETVFPGHVGPYLPLAKHIAVALAVVGGGAGTEEIPFIIAAHLGAANRGLGQQRGAGLPGSEVVLGHLAQCVVGIRNSGEWCVDVAAGGAIAENRFGRDEAAGCNADALILDGGGAGFIGLFRFRLFRGHGGLEDFVAGLQVADGGVERNGSRPHFRGGVYRFDGFGAGFGCTSVGRRGRFARLVDLAVALGELLLQHLKLFLLRLQS